MFSKQKPARDIITVVLFVFAMLSCWYTYTAFHLYEKNIVLLLDDVFTELAFPYHEVEMRLKPKVEKIPVPVYGVPFEEVEDTWGFARTEGRTHEGSDIFAPSGTPVFSVTEGYVVDTYFGHRGGNNVMVLGPGGIYYYYAHFERLAADVERGMKVTPDTVLGYVGTSGNAEGTPPHLHFGMYVKKWDAINPYPFFYDRWY